MTRAWGAGLRRVSPVLLPVLLVAVLAGCHALGYGEERKLPGKRISVLTLENQIQKDPTLASTPVVLPPPTDNLEWTQPGGSPDNAMAHVALGNQLRIAWTVEVGVGKAGTSRILSPPIVAGGRVFTMDAQSTVTAVDAGSGRKLWQLPLAPKKEDKKAGYGGGLAFENGRLFAASGFGFVAAVAPENGKVLWRQGLEVPIRAAPVAAGGQVYAITEDNQIFALAENDGHQLWNFQGIVEPARLLGNPSVAVSGDVVIVPFSSGELFALRIENGKPAWSDFLTRTGPLTALSTLSDIAGRPVIANGVVYASSHSGRTVAIDGRTGERVWSLTLASAEMPWVAGDFLYLVTVDGELVCLTRASGRVKWVSQLPRYKDPKDKDEQIEWSGPVLAGDRLILTSSNGKVGFVSPYDGKMLGTAPLPSGTFVPPVVARRTLYVLTGDAKLLALR